MLYEDCQPPRLRTATYEVLFALAGELHLSLIVSTFLPLSLIRRLSSRFQRT